IEARLLSRVDVGEEAQPVLEKGGALAASSARRRLLSPIPPAARAPDDDAREPELPDGGGDEIGLPSLGSLRREVEDPQTVVDVEEDARTRVALGIDRAKAGRRRRQDRLP